jgi:hypothetical protein
LANVLEMVRRKYGQTDRSNEIVSIHLFPDGTVEVTSNRTDGETVSQRYFSFQEAASYFAGLQPLTM